MATKPLRLVPFTNLSYVLNPTLRTLETDNGTGDHSVFPIRNHDNVITVSTNSVSAMESHSISCHVWQETQHTMFQLANLCAAVSLLTPSSFRHHLLFLRSLLLVAYLLLVLWAGLFVCMLDVLLWNCVFFVVDFVHIVCLVYKHLTVRLNPNLNELYCKKLKPLNVCRRDFVELCSLGSVICLRRGCRYSVENNTPCGDKVSILLQGRLKVTHSDVFLHSIEPNEFVDSPEFDSVPYQSSEACERYQVTIAAVEESLVISWLYPSIKAHLAARPFIATVLKNLIGKDISDKLYRVQELLQRDQAAISRSFLTRSSPNANGQSCFPPLDPHRSHFTNASCGVWKSDLSLCSLQAVPVTAETTV